MNKKDGGPAFPMAGEYEIYDPDEDAVCLSGKRFEYSGMSLRDYFAAHVTVNTKSTSWYEVRAALGIPPDRDISGWTQEISDRYEALRKYQKADAMLKEREK